MKPKYFIHLFAALFIFRTHAFTQKTEAQKYHISVVTLDNVYEGEAAINLYGENQDSIKLEWQKISADSSTKTIYWVNFNVDAISSVVINRDTLFFKNLMDDFGKTKYNCLVKKIYGTDMFGLFQFAENPNQKSVYVGIARHDPYYINHPIFTGNVETQANVLMYFRSCSQLYQKMKTGQPGYWFKKENNTDERVAIWKRIIDEYQAYSSASR